VNPSQSPAFVSSTDTYLQLDASSLFNEHHFTSRIASKCAECGEVHFAKFGNEKGNLLFCQNFYIILDKSLNSLESFHTGAC